MSQHVTVHVDCSSILQSCSDNSSEHGFRNHVPDPVCACFHLQRTCFAMKLCLLSLHWSTRAVQSRGPCALFYYQDKNTLAHMPIFNLNTSNTYNHSKTIHNPSRTYTYTHDIKHIAYTYILLDLCLLDCTYISRDTCHRAIGVV